jgi:large subunit ribosomal protein L24
MYIRRGDVVEVISGDDNGKRGPVTAVDRKNGTVTIQGVNIVRKHIKRGHPKSPQGGRLEIEMPLRVCKVSLIDPESNKPTRIGFRYLPDGSKERYAKRSGVSLGLVSPAKASRASS